MEFVDFNQCKRLVGLGYLGNAGRKYAILYNNEPWLLKFPKSTKHFQGNKKPNNHLPSYTTSPLCEYIGSKIYALLGIPTHDVLLGYKEGKVVVACKDFAVPDRLIEFAAIKNSVAEDQLEHGNSSSSRGEYLDEALRVLEAADEFEGFREKALERFWDMFVVDAFILNNDRNNGNWGILAKRFNIEMAPVYDNGNAFFNKKDNSLIERQVEDEKAVWNDIQTVRSFFMDAEGNGIHSFEYIAKQKNPDCKAALQRFLNNVDMEKIYAIVDEIPCECDGMQVMTPAQKQYYKTLLMLAYKRGILPAAEAQDIEV